ncbi:MAG: tetratricopeptide repeat protein, partial [Spirochaetes bacterium]|nr:tetratricopeptide repeat protein [Spirochaetota bacterium]
MKQHKTGIVLLVFFIVSISGTFSESGDIEKASDAEKKGNITEALNIYEEWLAGNRNSDDYYRILLHMCSIEPDPEKTIKIMKKYEKTVSKENTGDYYNRMAVLEEMTGEIDNAQKSYKKAWELESGNSGYNYLLSSAVMLFYMGNLEEAEKEALIVSEKSNDSYTAAKSLFLISSIYAANGDGDKAVTELEYLRKNYPDSNLIPSVLSRLIFLYREQNKNEKSKSLLEELKNKYPGSIQYKILVSGNNGRIRYFPNPAF